MDLTKFMDLTICLLVFSRRVGELEEEAALRTGFGPTTSQVKLINSGKLEK